MSIEQVPGTGLSYHLIAFDSAGRGRIESGGEESGRRALAELAEEPVTDVFLLSHGWQGDVPAARRQYAAWIRAMAGCRADIERMDRARGGAFRPLLIGLHWPSLPFGDEELGGGGASFAATADAAPVEVEAMVDAYAARIADTPAARAALRVIIERAIDDVAPDELPPEVTDACTVLDRESDLGAAGEGAEPGADREPFDPEQVYRAVQDEEAVSFGGMGFGGLLALPRTLSFWAMKDRARRLGEGGGHALLAALQRAAGADRGVRFHLMGHSFGGIVASAMLAGPGGRGGLPRPVDSLALVQGALSLWSYCGEIPTVPGRAGYFHEVLAGGRVRGPIVTTQSEYDVAVGRWYPLAAGVAGQVAFGPGELPRYGAVGAFGLRGLDAIAHDGEIGPADAAYDFEPGQVYNLEGSRVIRENAGFFVGAHGDFARLEVAHAIWSAALTVSGRS
jgi:hypothetical protein